MTTLDHVIQANAEAVLRETVAHWHARSATAVSSIPRTGDVLAMAQAPGYDANEANRVPVRVQRNRAVTDMYEPGSVFKLVTIAGALSEGHRHAALDVPAAVLDPRRRPGRPRRRVRGRPRR